MNSPSLSPGRQAYLLAVRRQKRQVRLWQAALLAGLLALWELSCRVGLSDGFLISSPSRMAATFASLCRGGDLWRHIGVSCGETVIGFRSKADGHLLNAVVVRSRADIETFYKSYGFVYTGKFDK